MKRLTTGLLIFAVIGCLPPCTAAFSPLDPFGNAGDGPYRPKAGEPHPDFVLPNIGDGKKVSLSQFRGKKLLLLHFASW